MRVLVTWGSKLGGTEGIAREIAGTLAARGHSVTSCAAETAPGPDGFDAVVLGGALHANRWHRAARRYADRHVAGLRRVPVWLFSSGPLDDTAARGAVAPTNQVAAIAERIGAREHVTFGGRLAPDARAWANAIADALPTATPGVAIEPAGHAWLRWYEHAVVGWAASAVAMVLLLAAFSTRTAIAVHAFVVPIVFAFVASHYFAARGAREPVVTAVGFAAVTAVLDVVLVAGLVQRQLSLVRSVAGMWMPVVSIFIVTWAVGVIRSMVPPPKPRAAHP